MSGCVAIKVVEMSQTCRFVEREPVDEKKGVRTKREEQEGKGLWGGIGGI